MEKITITIEDTMQDIINNSCELLTEYIAEYIAETIAQGEKPTLEYWYNVLFYGCGKFHDIIYSNTPIYHSEIDGLFYLYKDELIEAYENAGVGNLSDEMNPNQACIYYFLYEKLNDFYSSMEDYETSIMEYAKKHDKKEIEEYIMEVCFIPEVYPRA